jgi:hypothetical protein
MILTKSHTKYREYPSLALQHVGLSYVPTLPNAPKILLLVEQNWFSRYPRPRRSEFSFEFLELLHSYGVIAKSTTVKNPKLTVSLNKSIRLSAPPFAQLNYIPKPLMTLPLIQFYKMLPTG